MGKSAGGKQPVADYYMSLHYRIAHPIDELLTIFVGEKEAWAGTVSTETAITVNRPDLFGGNKKEGGTVGIAHFLPGGPTQVMPPHLAARLGLTSDTCPGYRELSSIFFTGSGSAFSYGGDGFLWGSNNPYLKSIWVKARRRPRGLSLATAIIDTGDGRKNVNPAHIIYECLTNTQWGQGGAPTGIDTPVFEAVAQTLFDEKFALSLAWTRQTDVESFVGEVLDHIQATMFVNPRNGLMTIKLIRGDYDRDDLPILNADNCTITSFDRKAWGETVNEIVVTYTNPENEQEETIAAQNNANIAIQGGIISDSRNYYAVRNPDLAQELAFRDLSTASAPLAAFEIEADRSAWDFVPGGCARLQYPEYGIEDTVIRIGEVGYGKPGDPTIKLSTLEDIFALTSAAYDRPDDTQWQDPGVDPEAAAFARIITAPAYFVGGAISAADADAFEYPEALAALLVSQTDNDTFSYTLYGIDTLPNGELVGNVIGSRPTIGHSLLPTSLPAAATTVLPAFGDVVGGPGPRPGSFIFIGNVNERAQEIALIDSLTDAGWLLKRGVLDTVPRAWPDGTTIWFVNTESRIVLDTTVYSDAETVNFKVAPSTSRGTLSFDDSPTLAATLTGRPHLPTRPANISVAGTAFGSVDLSASAPATVTVTWANRNRTLEDGMLPTWTDGSVIPEPGQTTSVRLFSTSGALLTSHDGLTGESLDIPLASWAGEAVADVAVYAVRDGLESLQSHRVRVKVRSGGYGDDWGNDWGGGAGAVEGPIGDPAPEPVPPEPEPTPQFPNLPPWKREYLNMQDDR